LKQLPSFVTTVTSKNSENFFSSDPELAKVLLFTNKKETTPLYKALSIDFHYQLNLGQVKDTETELVEKYKITKYPTLVVVPPSGDVVTYSGELKHAALFAFLKPHAKVLEQQQEQKTPPPPKQEEFVYDVKLEVKDQATFDKICGNTNCIVTLLDPENSSPEEHTKYLTEMVKVHDKNKNLFRFVWMDGVRQSDFTDKFNLNSGFPSVILVNQKKSSSIPYIGAFNEGSITEWLEKVLRGGIRASSVKTFPTVLSRKDEL